MSRRDEGGFASMVAVTVLAGVTLAAILMGTLGGLLVHQREAAAAADLAALAGATALQQGSTPCAAAARVAHLDDASLVRCQIAGERVTVSTEVPVPTPWGRTLVASAQATAGPR